MINNNNYLYENISIIGRKALWEVVSVYKNLFVE